jgi:hypothetical protein
MYTRLVCNTSNHTNNTQNFSLDLWTTRALMIKTCWQVCPGSLCRNWRLLNWKMKHVC